VQQYLAPWSELAFPIVSKQNPWQRILKGVVSGRATIIRRDVPLGEGG
jgi:hypothetical protein